jgi:hypothetical protein
MFNVYWKKQFVAFQLISLMHLQRLRAKTALKSNHTAHKLVSVLDETNERNLDYMLSVNTMTAYLLLHSKKPNDALQFIQLAERLAFRLLD